MSNSLFMDESNGNGVYASKSNNAVAMAAATTTNNISNIMNAAAAASATAATTTTLPTSLSNEDLSQSLSEYTDADESISAPTEFLAEFLSAVMLKDYKKALKYCKLILQYEPNNATAKEFYPLIQEKLKEAAITVNSNSDSDENYNKSSSPEVGLELAASTEPSAGESDEASDDQIVGAEADEYGAVDENSSGENGCCSSSSGSGIAGASISDSVGEDDEDDDDVEDDEDIDDDDDEDEDEDDDVGADDEEDINSSSGDDLPIDDNNLLGAIGGAHGLGGGGGGNDSSRHSSSGAEGRSRSDNTTHSYSSLLLEEEEVDDMVSTHLSFGKELSAPDLDVSNGNKINSTSCSDSESPTEPLTQRLAAILRSKCVVNSDGENY